jgi:branched-chain amino acid aminotransferase
MISWSNAEKQWSDPKIVPYQNLSISPVATCLNYGLTCFEGMKAYKALSDPSGNDLRLFRPDKNMQRLQNSMKRLHMPGSDFDTHELLSCIQQLVKLDKDWIPYGEGYSLYLRPNVIATHRFLGLAAPEALLLYVVTSPVGPYYKTGFQPIRLQCSTNQYVRAWPGGTGNFKVGGNYAPTMKPAALCAEEGYSQVLWLLGDEITEVGAMNVFFVVYNDTTGRKELITPPLERGDILPGVTRDSIVQLAHSWKDIDMIERNITMAEVKQKAKDGQLIEAFGAGTAAVVTPISCINYNGQDIDIPATGQLTTKVWNELTGIQYGMIEGPKDWSVKF